MNFRRPSFYLWMALAMCATTFYGFGQTYFAKLSDGSASGMATVVHVHGWTFFLWYLLLPLQAGLINTRKLNVHRTLGLASIVIAAMMVATGFVVVAVRIFAASSPDAGPFWRLFGPVILSTLLLFAVFYVLAIRNRHTPEVHKRLILVASAAGIGAATFRALASVVGFHIWVPALGIVVSNVFILIAIVRDWRVQGRVHNVYWIGLIACLVIEGIGFALPLTSVGQAFGELLAAIGEQLAFLYDQESTGLQ